MVEEKDQKMKKFYGYSLVDNSTQFIGKFKDIEKCREHWKYAWAYIWDEDAENKIRNVNIAIIQ